MGVWGGGGDSLFVLAIRGILALRVATSCLSASSSGWAVMGPFPGMGVGL